jgi:cell wall-associated NlpC family hydrolase
MRQLLLLCGFVASLLPQAGAAATVRDAAMREGPITHALRALGTRYRYGGASPETGFDCSGLIAHVFEQAGRAVPRTAREQSRVGTPVKRAQLAPGDLVFYNTRNAPYSHVGMYVGNGRFVHAPRSGAKVRIERLDTPYWKARFNGARRLHIDNSSH